MAAEIALPEHLAFPEGFGKVSWSVRGLIQNYTGWYDENPLSLLPSSNASVFDDIVELCGVGKLLERANRLLDSDDLTGALHLTDIVLKNDPGHREMLSLRKKAFTALLQRTKNWGEANLIRFEIRKIEEKLK